MLDLSTALATLSPYSLIFATNKNIFGCFHSATNHSKGWLVGVYTN